MSPVNARIQIVHAPEMLNERLLEALRRLAQAIMFGVGVTFLALQVWSVAAFPRDKHPWLAIIGFAAAASLPVAICWAELTGSRAGRITQVVASWFSVTTGIVLLSLLSSWAGSLFANPYNGPMSAEATVFELAFCVVAGSGSACLTLSPILLDRNLINPSHRRTWLRLASVGLAIVTIIGLTIGPHLIT
jgi:hypothetical protein